MDEFLITVVGNPVQKEGVALRKNGGDNSDGRWDESTSPNQTFALRERCVQNPAATGCIVILNIVSVTLDKRVPPPSQVRLGGRPH